MRRIQSFIRTSAAIFLYSQGVAALPSIALAQSTVIDGAAPMYVVEGSAAHVAMTLGKGQLFKIAAPYSKISVTDEKVVEAAPQSDQEILFNPKSVGTTNVFIFDAKNLLIVKIDVSVASAQIHSLRSGEYSGLASPVQVYGHIYDTRGAPVKPTLYQCSSYTCVNVIDAVPSGPSSIPVEHETPPPPAGRPNAE